MDNLKPEVKVHINHLRGDADGDWAYVSDIQMPNPSCVIVTISTQDKYVDVTEYTSCVRDYEGRGITMTNWIDHNSHIPQNFISREFVFDLGNFKCDHTSIVPLKHEYALLFFHDTFRPCEECLDIEWDETEWV